MQSSFASWNPLFDSFSSATMFSLPSPVDFLDMDATRSQLNSASSFFAFSNQSPVGDRSPSIGISLSPSDRDPCSRPSSELNGFFASFDYSRVDSAFDKISEDHTFSGSREATPNTLEAKSLEEGGRESPVVVGIDDWANWGEWGIKTAPGCPPLGQLFENKRRWREKFNAAIPPPMQRHCVFCRSMKKSPQEFLSHNIRDEKGVVTCPILSVYRCPNCGEKGHTIRYCLRPQTVSMAKNYRRSSNGQRKHVSSY